MVPSNPVCAINTGPRPVLAGPDDRVGLLRHLHQALALSAVYICVGVPRLVLGVAFTLSLKQQGITDLVIPASNLVVFLVLSAILGLAAASWPAP